MAKIPAAMDRPLRILLMGDASNYHRALATGLRELGHDVVVASSGSKWQNTERDIDLRRRLPGMLGGAELWLRLNLNFNSTLGGYDIVSIANHGFVDLKPNRMRQIFDRVVRNNGHVFLTALGSDPNYVRTCISPDSPLKYTEWMVNGNPSPLYLAQREKVKLWTAPEISGLYNHIYSTIKGAVAALYEYHEICRKSLPDDKVAYGGIPIATDDIQVKEIPADLKRVTLFLGRHAERQVEKGTDRLYAAAKRVQDLHPDKCELVIVENVPYAQYLDMLDSAHVVLDQLYSYTPATNALLAMAKGKVAVSGAEPEFYDFIKEDRLRPVVNALPDDEALFATLERLVLHPESLRARGLESRAFVEKHNDTSVVAKRFLDFWQSKIS